MCYLVRTHAAQAEGEAAMPPSGSDRLRPRWAGALAALLVGGVALAAVLVPAPTSPGSQAPLGMTTAAMKTEATPTDIREAGLAADDGVPTAADKSKAAAGDCHHGL